MKRRFLSISLTLLLMVIATTGFGQAAMAPTIIVFPDDGWCENKHYGQERDVMGKNKFVPDYETALRRDQNMKDIIGAVEMILKDEGCTLQTLDAVLNSLEGDAGFDDLHEKKDSGSGLSSNPIDKYLSVAQADIIVKVGYEEMYNGPKKAIRFNLAAYDAFTNDPIDKESGVGSATSNSLDIVNQLHEAVLSFKDQFLQRMMSHFNEMFEQGRKVQIQVYRWDDCSIDFEEEYDDEELKDLIEEWVADNAIGGRYTKGRFTENQLVFTGVRIPMHNKKGKAMTAQQFAKDLAKYIKELTKETCKVEERGLGWARVTMGGK